MVLRLAWLVWAWVVEMRVGPGLIRSGEGAVGKLGSGYLLPTKLTLGEVLTVEKLLMISLSLVVVEVLLVEVVEPVLVEMEPEVGPPVMVTGKLPEPLVMVMLPPVGAGLMTEMGVATMFPTLKFPKLLVLDPLPVTKLVEVLVTEFPPIEMLARSELEDPLMEPPMMLELVGPPKMLTPEAVLVLLEEVVVEVEVMRMPRFTILSATCPAASVARTLSTQLPGVASVETTIWSPFRLTPKGRPSTLQVTLPLAPSVSRLKISWEELLKLDLTTLIVSVLVFWAEARTRRQRRARKTLFIVFQFTIIFTCNKADINRIFFVAPKPPRKLDPGATGLTPPPTWTRIIIQICARCVSQQAVNLLRWFLLWILGSQKYEVVFQQEYKKLQPPPSA